MKNSLFDRLQEELESLKKKADLRTLPQIVHKGRNISKRNAKTTPPDSVGLLLNLSSNDYLALASDATLRDSFFSSQSSQTFLPSASSSRLLTGNYVVCEELERELATLYGSEAVLVFNSGYHANTGIIPAISDANMLILADKLVHASLIDGIRLSSAPYIRYRHNQYNQLERLIEENHSRYETILVVTESIFSMDGDEADLLRLVKLKRKYPKVLLYVDEAHAFGVRGEKGLGCAEVLKCMGEIDFLVGTFGKALASTGAFVVCKQVVKEYLINRMRTLIFTTALPPVIMEWTLFLVRRLPDFYVKREYLTLLSKILREELQKKGHKSPSTSHIVPILIGDSDRAVYWAEEIQKKGFHVLPVRPPTVRTGTSRIRISLTADINFNELKRLISVIPSKDDL